MIYRIYTKDKNRESLLRRIDSFNYLPGYTVFLGQGRWQGLSEPSLIIEYVSKGPVEQDEYRVTACAAFIKGYNQQEEVWIVKVQESSLMVI